MDWVSNLPSHLIITLLHLSSPDIASIGANLFSVALDFPLTLPETESLPSRYVIAPTGSRERRDSFDPHLKLDLVHHGLAFHLVRRHVIRLILYRLRPVHYSTQRASNGGSEKREEVGGGRHPREYRRLLPNLHPLMSA